MRRGLSPTIKPGLILAVLFAGLATGCQTTVGNYLANRGRDLGECFLLQTGLGFGIGADLKVGGLVHAGVLGGTFFPGASFGWVYGDIRPRPYEIHDQEGDIGFPIALVDGFLHQGGPGTHFCYGLLPGLLSWTGPPPPYPDLESTIPPGPWLWSEEADRREDRWARVHAFDIEISAYALIVGARVGFSPGEFVDFFLGWFGADIAGDDIPLKARESPVEEE